jgi:catechol 2,3-dioxygenase-like lactoylglutathione lyase family enzyme
MHRSRLVASLVDVPASAFDASVSFWSGALGHRPHVDEDDPEYAEFGEVNPGWQFMVQRLEGDEPARVHLDIETDDVDAEVRRLEALGAARIARVKRWWIMRDPAGLPFCVVPVQAPAAFEAGATTWPDP